VRLSSFLRKDTSKTKAKQVKIKSKNTLAAWQWLAIKTNPQPSPKACIASQLQALVLVPPKNHKVDDFQATSKKVA